MLALAFLISTYWSDLFPRFIQPFLSQMLTHKLEVIL
jgi:hypothetical protein